MVLLIVTEKVFHQATNMRKNEQHLLKKHTITIFNFILPNIMFLLETYCEVRRVNMCGRVFVLISQSV